MGVLLSPKRLRTWVVATTALVAILQVLRGSQALEFSFPPYPAVRAGSVLSCTGSSQLAVNPDQWCRIRPDGNSFELTPTSGTGANSFNTSSRLMYNRTIRFYDSSTGQAASFSAFFIFHISKVRAQLGSGMTFLIAPNVSTPESSFGGELGLFDGDTGGTGNPKLGPSRIVAVEIDTYQRGPFDWGPAPHVGLDIDSVKSVNASYLWNETVFAEQQIAVWVDYDAQSQYLEVRLKNVTDVSDVQKRDGVVWLTYSGLNLSAHVNEYSYVGFSGAAGSDREDRGEVHEIFNWTFSTTGLPEEPSGGRDVGLIAGLAVGSAVVLLVVIMFVATWWWKRTKKRKRKGTARFGTTLGELGFSGVDGPREFSYQELKAATSHFSDGNVLGEGGFGKVYRGVMADESLVAVKRIAQDSSQGEREFVAEVTIIGRLRHRNLVPLKGWCRTEDELLLVYEYMPQGSLFDHIFQASPGSSAIEDEQQQPDLTMKTPLASAKPMQVLSWEHRYRILQGVASALHYLHAEWEEQTIIHRDVKSSNVMIDANWNARLGDFGLARLVKRDKSAATVTKTAGTQGYLAPECVYTDKVSAESDVFSYGVMVLEVATGRKPIDWFRPLQEKFLVNWIWTLSKVGSLLEAADPKLAGAYDAEQMVAVLKMGLMCCAEEPIQRPTMKQVIQCFSTGSSIDIDVPASPGWMPPLHYRIGAVFSDETTSTAGVTSSSSLGDTASLNSHLLQSMFVPRSDDAVVDLPASALTV